MEIAKLTTFLKVVEYGSFKAAANKLYLSPRAVSKQINQIEAEIGIKLFSRETNNSELTSAGKEFLVTAQDIVNSYNSGITKIQLEKSKRNRTLKIGYSSTNQGMILQNLFLPFVKDHPQVRFAFKEENGQRLATHISDGTLDLAVTPNYGKTLFLENSNLHSKSIASGKLVFGISKSNPLSRQTAIKFNQISNMEILYYSPVESSYLKTIFLEKFPNKIDSEKIRRVNTLEQRDMLVAFNFGIGFYPSPFMKREQIVNPMIQYLPIEDMDVDTTYSSDILYNPSNHKAAVKQLLTTIAVKKH